MDAPTPSSSSAARAGSEKAPDGFREYRIRFFTFNMGNNNKLTQLAELQGPGGRGRFVDALNGRFADGRTADIVYTTLQETRLNLTEWVSGYSAANVGGRMDTVLFQNARREGARNTKSRVRGWVEGAAAKYNGNLKAMLAFSSERFTEDSGAALFGRLTEVTVAGVPVPNPKKAFIGKTVVERTDDPNTGLRCCFVGAHFPVAKLAAALEGASEQLHLAKVALARSLRKILKRAASLGIADGRTILFVAGDLNSRTVLLAEGFTSEYRVVFDGSGGGRLGLELNDSGPTAYTNTGYLIVTAIIRGGLIEAWNQNHKPSDQVRVGDCIMEVNGIRDDLPRLHAELYSAKTWDLRLHRRVADVLLELLRDDDFQAAIQHDFGLPPGRWHEIAEYETAYDLPVTYKFLDHVACGADVSPSARRGGASALTISDIMSVEVGSEPTGSESPMAGGPSRAKSDDAQPTSSVDVYRRQMTRMGNDKLQAFGLAYKKHDFRAFRFPAGADRMVFWAPDTLSDRISFEFPRGGYEVNHMQLGSDHRPVTLEVVMRVAPEGNPLRHSAILHQSHMEQLRMMAVLAQSDEGEAMEGDDDDNLEGTEGNYAVSEPPMASEDEESCRPTRDGPGALSFFSGDDDEDLPTTEDKHGTPRPSTATRSGVSRVPSSKPSGALRTPGASPSEVSESSGPSTPSRSMNQGGSTASAATRGSAGRSPLAGGAAKAPPRPDPRAAGGVRSPASASPTVPSPQARSATRPKSNAK